MENTPNSPGKASLDTPMTLQGLGKPRGCPAWLMFCTVVSIESTAELTYVMSVCVCVCVVAERRHEHTTGMNLFMPCSPWQP